MVPCYNEETQIGKVIETMPAIVDHIIIVDDCSPDKTSEVVNGYKEEYPQITLVRHEENQGVGGAIASGYIWARDNNIDVTVVMAGDAQMDPNDLEPILDPVVEDRADYSKGNRLITGEAFQKIPKIRFFGNSALSLLTKIASGYWHIADSQTGYCAINLKALKRIDWTKMYKRYGQPNDVLVKLNVEGFRVSDVPIEPVYHVGEKSGIKVRKVLFTISWLLLKLFFWRLKEKYIIRDFHPLIFFYFMGMMLLGASGFLFIRLIYLWAQFGHAPELTVLALLFASSTGMQSIFFAMWFDMESNKHLR